MKEVKWHRALLTVFKRECRRLVQRPLYLFCMVIAPLFCTLFFTSLMREGLPQNLPVGAVDADHSSISRTVLRNLNSFPQTEIVGHYADVAQARRALQRGEIYGFFYIPQGMARDALANRQPTVSFYSNYAYLIAGSLIYRDMRTMSELTGGAVARQTLYAKGATEQQTMALLQPLVIETHALNNPWLNYSVYLSNTLIPGLLSLLIIMITVYSIGVEIKERTSRQWLVEGGRSIVIALTGKLWPQTLVFFLMGLFYNVYLYAYLHYPCNGGIAGMILNSCLFILASQGLGVLMITLIPVLRLGLSFASLWGVVSFSISGFSFPVMAMDPTLQAVAWLFPLRHYFLIYVNHALNGYSAMHVWPHYLALILFCLLPLFLLGRLKKELIYMKYIT